MGNSQSNEQWPERVPRRRDRRGGGGASVGYDAQSSPMQVPVGGSHSAHHQHHSRDPSAQYDQREAALPVGSDDYALKSNLNFPPRLPLPIQEEVYTPGSPIITPDDLSQALREDEEDTILPTRTSLLSHTTADEEEDAAEYGSEANRGRTVPTVIRWRGDADRVYITGSFAAWARKFRMHREYVCPVP
jgi:Glycogen recognition site of AMP-activated protein kinase